MRGSNDENTKDSETSGNSTPCHYPKRMQNAPQEGSHGHGVKSGPVYYQIVYPYDRRNMQHEAFYLGDIYHLHGMMKFAKQCRRRMGYNTIW